MGKQIIQQPDGHFAVFSSVTDTIVMWDATAVDVEDYFAELAAKDARSRVRAILKHVKAGAPRLAYFQFALTWEEALLMDKQHAGDVWRQFAEVTTDGD